MLYKVTNILIPVNIFIYIIKDSNRTGERIFTEFTQEIYFSFVYYYFLVNQHGCQWK